MKLIYYILMITFTCNFAAAELQMYALYEPNTSSSTDGDSKNRRVYDVVIVIKNVGESQVVIPKAGIGPSIGRNSAGEVCVWYSCSSAHFENSTIKLSECEYLPVRLSVGQVTMITYTLDVPADQDMTKIYFRYMVSAEMAAEYGFWTGELKGQLRPYEPAQIGAKPKAQKQTNHGMIRSDG